MSAVAPILIAGPTASGKSALALRLADGAPATIINADSMQVYRELRVLTARPTLAEMEMAPHSLYGHVPAREAYSVGRFITEATDSIRLAQQAGRRPILVGGTGLYFKALLEGLSPIPAVADDVRAHWRAEAGRLGAPALHAVLMRRDPEVAQRLAPSDTQRIVRALEVLESSGHSLAYWQSIKGAEPPELEGAHKIVVVHPRADLYARADHRFAAMIADGALEEVAALRKENLAPDVPAMGALGVRPLMQHLSGERDLADAIAQAKRDTQHFIKRQLTWQKKYMIAWKAISTQQMGCRLRDLLSFIDS